MYFSDAELDMLMGQHDGTRGYGGQMCPGCEVIHPCLVWRLCNDSKEARMLLVRQEPEA